MMFLVLNLIQNHLILLKIKILWKIIHHMQGTPQTMQINPFIIMFY